MIKDKYTKNLSQIQVCTVFLICLSFEKQCFTQVYRALCGDANMATELMLPGNYSQTVQNAKSHVTPSLTWCHHSFVLYCKTKNTIVKTIK